MKQNVHAVTGKPLSGNYSSHLKRSAGNKWLYSLLLAFFFVPTVLAQSAPELKREWVKQIGNSTSSDDRFKPNVAAIGPDQMAVVVGFSNYANGLARIMIKKLNQSGSVVWQHQYAGPAGSTNETPYQVHIDDGGNVYILGSTMFEPEKYEFLVLKYKPDGQLSWAQHLYTGFKGRNLPAGLAVDSNGNVYVTGEGVTADGNVALTAKIDSKGDIIWSETFVGPTSDSDPKAQSIALDNDGNPVISGTYYTPGQGNKLFVLKYKQQNGEQHWLNLFTDAATEPTGLYTADKLLVDASGSVYVAGTRSEYNPQVNAKPLLVKLDNQGNLLWSKLDESPSYNTYMTDAALDTEGNPVLLGLSEQYKMDTEVYLAKYNSAGEKLWGDIIVDEAGENSYPGALAISSSGEIAFTGYTTSGTYPNLDRDLVTFLYSSGGGRLDVDRYNETNGTLDGKDLVFDGEGNLYTVANISFGTGTLVVKHKTSNAAPPSSVQNQREWLKQFSLPVNSYASSHALKVGPDNMPVAVGTSRDANNITRVVITKLTPSGTFVWQREFEGASPSSSHAPYDFEMDEQGNIYIFSILELSEDDHDLVVVKYNPDGQIQWARQFKGGDNRDDIPVDMAVNQTGEVFITAHSSAVGDHKTFTAKFDSSGMIAWTQLFDGPEDDSEPSAHAIALDPAGNPIVSGNHFVTGQGKKLFILKYSQQDGQQQWVKYLNEMDAASGGVYTADRLFSDAEGNIYLAGTKSSGDLTNSDILLLKLDMQGNMLWSKLDETTSFETFLTDAELDEQNNLVVLASSQFGRNSTEAYLAKYSAAGERLWGELIVDAAGENIYPNALAIQEGGNIAFTGFIRGSLAHELPDYITFLYSSGGEQLDMDRYAQDEGSANGRDLAFADNGKLYVAGHTTTGSSDSDLLVVKYNTGIVPSPPAGSTLSLAWAITEEDEGEAEKVFIGAEQNPVVVSSRAITAFTSEGEKVWESKFTIHYKNAVQDSQNNIYILSELPIDGENRIVEVKKFNSSGERLWGYQGQIHYTTAASGIAVNDSGEVFVAITVYESDSDTFVRVIKLNADGTKSWEAKYDGFGDMNPKAASVALDGNGYVYVTGHDRSVQAGNRPYLLKLDNNNGQLIWERQIRVDDESYFKDYYPQQLLVGPEGQLLLAGTTQSCCISHPEVFVFSADQDGNIQWEAAGGPDGEKELLKASVGPEGEVALIGTIYNPRENINTTFVSVINEEGQEVWNKIIDGLGEVHVLDNGLVAVSGGFDSVLFVHLYDHTGAQVKQGVYGGNTELQETGAAIATDEAGNLYVAGNTMESFEPQNLLLLKYGSGVSEEPAFTPVDVKLYLPPMAKRVGWQVRTTADFGDYILNEDTGVRWTWGDGSEPTISYTAFGTPRITGEHTYQKAGIYTIGLDFEESNLRPTSEDYTQQMVIFDPEAGFVTGSGEFQAPEALGIGDTQVSYSFSVKYPNQYATEPVGTLQVKLGDKGTMISRNLDWLVIDGNRAAMQGTASIVGVGTFMVVATMMDGGGEGPDDPSDGLRLQVWDTNAHGKLLFDSNPAHATKLDLHQPLPSIGKGQIIINGDEAAIASIEPQGSESAKAYPNPFVDRTTVTFTSPAAGAYEAILYNANGTVVSILESGTAEASEEIAVEVDGRSLHNGLYFVKLSTGGKVQTAKLLLQR